MIIEQGDGSIAKRLNEGRCPTCRAKLPPANGHMNVVCKVCNLIISVYTKEDAKSDWPIDRADD